MKKMESELLRASQRSNHLEDTTPVLIGLSLRLPQIENEEALWHFLTAGEKTRCMVDGSRMWRTESEKTYANLFADWDFFVPSLFNLTAKDLAHIDPQQKLALYGVHTCLENSGMTRHELQQATTGVYAGVMTVDNLHSYAMSTTESDSRFFLNNCEACVANRVSHCFNFTGESKSINAACASSLVALKDACESIKQGQNDFAFAIGVNYIDSALRHQSFKKAGMLSRSGWCHTFSMLADGYLPSEGIVTLLITSKAKADALNLPVLAAVVGISCNHNGYTSTMTAPSAAAQSRLIRLAQKQCSSLDVAYVEAHGTGTNLGDPIELEALSHNYPGCVVGSIKANLGHMEAGAGLLGVAKCLMILKNRQIPPHVLSDKTNVLLPKTLFINTETVSYNHLQVAVSSFGFGGVNAHAILQRVPARKPIRVEQFKLPLLISASTKEDLVVLMERAENYVQQEQPYHLALNSIYMQEHGYPHRKAGWLNQDNKQIDWISISDAPLILPSSCQQLGPIKLRPYLQQCSSLNLTEYWVNLIHDFLPSVRCIEAYGRGVALAIQTNQRAQTHLVLNGETYSALSNLDGYVLKLVDGLKIEHAQANSLIDESIDLYQHQYTFKALLQTVLTAELIAQFEQHDSQQIQSNFNQELILLLLWARIGVINKWQLSTVKDELLRRFSPAYAEIIFLLEQHVLAIDELKSLLCSDSVFMSLFKKRLMEKVTTVSEACSFALLSTYYKPILAVNDDSVASIFNQCIFHFKVGQSITIDMDYVSEKEALTLSDDVVLQLWLQGFEIDFGRYLGAMLFERKPYFKKTKNQITAKQFYTLQTTLKCINEHEFFKLHKIRWADFTVTDILEKDVCVVLDYPEKKPIHWGMEIIRQIAVKSSLQVKKQRIIYLQLDEKFSPQEVQLFTHFVKAVNLELNPLRLELLDFQGRYYQYDKIPLQFPAMQNKSFEHQGLYVLVGGAGGIGLKLGTYLRTKYDAQIHVLGRKLYAQLNVDVQMQLQQYNMIYHCCDLGTNDVLFACLKQIAAAEKITGIFHLAVERQDEWWMKQSENSLSATLVQVFQRNGWFVAEELSKVTKNLYVFTSIQAFYPNLGATIYSFEAALKNYFATLQKNLPCFVTALGVIEGIGLARSADYSQYMASNDLAPLSFDEFMMLFELQIQTHTPFALITGSRQQSDFIATADINKHQTLELFVALSLLLRINQSFSIQGLKVAEFLAFFQKHFQQLAQELLYIWQMMHFIQVEKGLIFVVDHVEKLVKLKANYEDELKEGNYTSRLKLFAAVCTHYDELLLGKILPQQVIFPNGSTELVQSFYEQHSVADFANQILAAKLRNYCESAQRTIRILEVGAGSGASTRAILTALKEQSYIYYFTDISSALVNKAKQYFSEHENSIVFQIFDMEHMDSQHEFYQAFDFVIATNAIHATRDILNSLNSLTECLVDGGHLLLNELVEKTNYTTAIFGLFDGWWNSRDQHVRQINSPLLSADQWISVLQKMGLKDIEYQSSSLNFSFAEQIVIDAAINRQHKSKSQSAFAIPQKQSHKVIHPTKNQQWIIEQLAQTLYLDSESIQLEDRLSELGFDSLSLSDLYQKLKPKYPELGIAELFAVDTVQALISLFNNTRLLSKLAAEDEVRGDTERRTGVYTQVHEDSSTVSTKQFSSAVEFGKKSNENYPSSLGNDVAVLQDNGAGSLSQVTATPSSRLQEMTLLDENHDGTLEHYNLDTDIAIVGLSYQLPHTGSGDFISMLQQGKTAFGAIPKERWQHDAFFDAHQGMRGKSYACSGSFLIDVDCFDEVFFKLSPREAAFIDPQERLLLQNAYSALEDAHAFPIDSDNKIAVFVGISGAYYSWLNEDWTKQKHANSSCAYWSAANRISYSFNLHGPSMAVDTACSSSLTALHLACQSVITDESTMAVVGGVNLIVHPRQMVELSDLHMLSAKNVNASFSQNADGFVYSEGVVTLCIKKLSAAVATGNRIYGVIKGSALNSGGKMHGYTVPNPEAQKRVIISALKKAGINARQINYIEAHGTGTVLGDPIEIKALSEVYQNKVMLGSIKSNIGHSEACAGLAGLVKILLQYQHEEIFAGVNAWPLNEHCHFEKTQFIIPEKNSVWETRKGLRYSALSSFGAGGSNAHIILQDYPIIPVLRAKQHSFKKQAHWIVPRNQSIKTQEYPLVLETNAYYFDQHRLHQRPILPGVAHVYFCYQAYLKNRDTKQNISIRDIKWLNPIYADHDTQYVSLTICFKPAEGYTLCELSGALLHSSCSYHLLDESISMKDFEPLNVACVQDVSAEKMYARFRQSNWYHGSALQCVQTIQVNQNRSKAIASLSLAESQGTDPTLDPRLFDSVLQCVSVLQEGLPADQVYIPQGIEALDIFQVWTNTIYVVVEDKSIRQFSPRYDIFIFDEHHNLVSQIIGFCMIPIHKEQIAPPKSIHYFKPFWQRIQCDKAGGRPVEWLNISKSSLDEAQWNLGILCQETTDMDHSIADSSCLVIQVNQLSCTQQFINLLQNLQRVLCSRRKVRFILCFDDSGDTAVYAQGVHAYLRTAQREFPELHFSVVLLPWEWSTQLLPLIAQHQLPSWVKVTKDGSFHTQYYHSVTPERQAVHSLFKKSGVYVISGGLGAISKIIAQYLVTQYQARILLLGRRKPSEDNIRWLQQHSISYKQVDVSDYETLHDCIAHFVLDHGGVLNGCIHAAGVQQDGLILNQSDTAIETALSAKVIGALNLDRATINYPLDHFLLLSSYSSILANIGQSAYAAANGFLDGFAVLRESLRIQGKRSGFTCSINLPFWEQGGMQVSDSVLARMQKEWGMQAIDNTTGCHIFETLSSLSWPQLIAHQGDQKIFIKQLNYSFLAKPNRSEVNMEFKLFVIHTIKKVLEIESHFDGSVSFGDLGFNSILFTELANHLNDAYALAITPATFFAYKTVAEFIEHYEHQVDSEVVTMEQPELRVVDSSLSMPRDIGGHVIERDLPVIVGYSALLPGCSDLNDFWQLLLNQHNVFSQTPANRLHYMQEHSGAFIDGVDAFDAAFFNLSPLEAKVMDPQQRLLLQEVWHALEMGGINPLQLKGSATGVYVGASTFDYAKLLTRNQINNPYIPVATVHSLLANRISHYFDLNGPSESVDTACSSSLYALDRAVKAIKQGEIDQAIVCGVNLLLDDEFFNAFTQSGMLSATRICKPFDKNADGYIRGEGIIVLLLQKQAVALAQNNTIYARVLASGVNHTGKANTLTSPSSKAHQQLYGKVYESLDMTRISYIEAHGTGTPLGDPIELEGLKNFVADKKVSIEVGSVKGNIGHLEPASGLAGLLKILLMFQHEMIPGQANLSEINPYLLLQQSGLSISQKTHLWPQTQINGELIPRCAAVNSFGFGGVNAHVVLEQGKSSLGEAAKIPEFGSNNIRLLRKLALEREERGDTERRTGVYARVHEDSSTVSTKQFSSEVEFPKKSILGFRIASPRLNPLLPLSAANESSLRTLVQYYIDWLQKTNDLDPQSLCCTLQKRRVHHRFRVIFQWQDRQQLMEHMQSWFNESADPYITDDYKSKAQAYLAGEAVFTHELNADEVLAIHSTPAYPFLRKKIWFKAQDNRLVYVPKEMNIDEKMKHQPLRNQNIVIIHADCFAGMMKQISMQLEVNNTILSYNLHHFDADEFQLFLAANPNIDRFIIYPQLLDFNLDLNLFHHDLLALLQPLFDLLKVTLSSQLFAKKISVELYSHVAEANHPQAAMICGLLGSLAKELLHWQVKHFIIDKPLELSMLETMYEGSHQTIQYQNGHYWLKTLNQAIDCEENDFLSTQGTYLVLGGMGGIGRRVTQFLIEAYHAKVILVGRSPLNEEGREFLHAYGDHIEFIQTDVTREAECALLIKYLHLKHPTIDAVFNLVMQLQDSTVDSMTWQQFSRVIHAKLFSAYFIHQLHQQTKIKAAVIFSSMQSNACLAGQANYAAASSALDAYCLQLEKNTDLTIKIINWSIWQEVGAVTDSFYLNRAHDLGFIPLTSQQALEAMQIGLNSQYTQFAIQNKIMETKVPKAMPSLFLKDGLEGVNQFVHVLINDLRKKQIFLKNVIPKYTRLAEYLSELSEVSSHAHSLEYLLERCCQQHPDYEAYYRLSYQCYLDYEAILAGNKAPAEIIFSENGLKLLHALYAKSPESRRCNQQIANHLSDYLNSSLNIHSHTTSRGLSAGSNTVDRLQDPADKPRDVVPRKRIKILELGAGVGATTETLIDVLNAYEQIDYYYSDVSSFFLNQGKKLQAKVRFNLRCDLVDMNHLAELADETFDIVLASNVIHLAHDLAFTLKEIKRMLKPQGIFLLNEAVKEQSYLNFIFGLFDGWWKATGADRLNASPLLNQNCWQEKLAAAGFTLLGQHLMMQDTVQKVFFCQISPITTQRESSPILANERQEITDKIAEFIQLALHLPKGQVLEVDRPLAEIGLDSITGVSLVTQINRTFNLSLRTAVIFDYPNLQRLAAFVHSELKDKAPVVTKQVVDIFAGELIDD